MSCTVHVDQSGWSLSEMGFPDSLNVSSHSGMGWSLSEMGLSYLSGQWAGGLFCTGMEYRVRSQWVLGLSGCYPHKNDGTEIADENMTPIADIGHIWLISDRFGHMNLKLAIFGLNSLSENGSKYQKSQILIICQNMQNIYLWLRVSNWLKWARKQDYKVIIWIWPLFVT